MSIDVTINELKSGKKKRLIAPSVISADFTKLKDELQAIEAAGADWLHVDVMDGQFVPNLTLGMFIVDALKKMTKLPLDCHLMMQHPENYVEQFIKAGAEFVTVHPESEGYIFGALDKIKNAGCRAGMAIKPATPVSVISDYIKFLDMILVMTVNPGFSGQTMIQSALPKYQECRKLFGNDILLEIDGGVMPENAAKVHDAGAQVIVAATAVFKSKSYKEAIGTLRG